MRVERDAPAPRFDVAEADGILRVPLPGVGRGLARGRRVAFFDGEGRPLLAEARAGVDSRRSASMGDYCSVRQRFESAGDESLHGTGLHQQGWMDLKGRDIELLQHNIDKAIPYLVSSRGYGILWDNNSITRYGDPRGLRQIGEVVALYDRDGVEGALTATYSIDATPARCAAGGRSTTSSSPAGGLPEEGKNLDPAAAAWWSGRAGSPPAATAATPSRCSAASTETVRRRRAGGRPLAPELEPVAPRVRARPAGGRAPRPAHRMGPDRTGVHRALQGRDPLPPEEAADLSIWSEAAQVIDYYVVAGGDMDGAIAGYRELTGKAVLLPKWAYGFWQSRERYKTQQELTGVLDEYRRRKLPIDAIVLDWSYWPEDAARTTSIRR